MKTPSATRYVIVIILVATCSILLTSNAELASLPDLRLTPAWTLAFERGDDIWTAHGDGTGQKRVIKKGLHPCWSPDKKLIAFERNDNLWISNADGTHQRQLTRHRTVPTHARTSDYPYSFDYQGMDFSWNRQFKMVTFSHPEDLEMILERKNRNRMLVESSLIYDVFLSRPSAPWGFINNPEVAPFFSSSNLLDVRFSPLDSISSYNFVRYEHPAWSHSGKYLAFACNGDIWIARNNIQTDVHVWGWDSSRLAATAEYDGANDRASHTTLAISRISWSPDDRFIAYSISRQGGSGVDEIHVIGIAPDKNPWKVLSDTNLYGKEAWSGYPCFSPDGKLIAYTSLIDELSIWVTSPDGKTRTKLIKNASYPAW